MKLGEITSCVGDMAVVSPLALEGFNVSGLYGRSVFSGGGCVGRVFDVIGRVDEPFFVVRLFSGDMCPSRLVGKVLHLK